MEKVIAKHPALNRKQARFEQKTNQGPHGIGPDARTEPEQLLCGEGGGGGCMVRGCSLQGKGRSKAHSSGRLGRDLETTALCPVLPQLLQLKGSLSPPTTEARMVLRLHAVPPPATSSVMWPEICQFPGERSLVCPSSNAVRGRFCLVSRTSMGTPGYMG